jgi:hypothetical protein
MNGASLTRALQETLVELDEEIKAAHVRVEQLELERQGVQAALKRFAREPSLPLPPTDCSHPPLAWRAPPDRGGLSDRVFSILTGADGPVSVSEIVDKTGLAKEQVRSALGYLNRKSQVKRAARGLWQPTSPPDAEAAPGATTGTASGSIYVHQNMDGGDARGTDSHPVRGENLLPLEGHHDARGRSTT